MMYTIEELESTFAELEANKGHLIGVDIMAALTEDDHVLEVMRQLLDAMRALQDAQARIDAAAAIDFMPHDFTVTDDVEHHFGKVDGWNACLLEFHRALGLD